MSTIDIQINVRDIETALNLSTMLRTGGYNAIGGSTSSMDYVECRDVKFCDVQNLINYLSENNNLLRQKGDYVC